MTVIFDLNDQILPLLKQILLTVNQMESKMAELDDRLAQVQAEIQAEATRINTDLSDRDNQINTLKAQVQAAQDQLAGAKLTDAQRASLDAIDQTIAGIDPIRPVTVPAVAPDGTGPTPATSGP